jgi:hypothetical protein
MNIYPLFKFALFFIANKIVRRSASFSDLSRLHKIVLNINSLATHSIQIMGQMAICKKPVCYFVVYTFCDIMIEKIEFDEHFYANMLPLLETFYTEHYVPAIVSTL